MDFLQFNQLRHSITGDDLLEASSDSNSDGDGTIFLLSSAYSFHKYHGIMIDTGAGGPSTCGENQLKAFQKLDSTLKLDTSSAGSKKVKFGIGRCESIGHVDVKLPFGKVTFHVMPADTPFLLGLADMDRIGVYFDNIDNRLVRKSDSKFHLVARKFGHPFLTFHTPEESMAFHQLTEKELRRLHKRFGHPSTRKLQNVIQGAGHTYNAAFLRDLQKYCHQCQLHSRAPHRFKFTLKDPINYNHTVELDLVKIGDRWVLHVVDEATGFHAAEFLKDQSAMEVWRAFDKCWNNVTIGPPVYAAHDPGKHFQGDFQEMAKTKDITTLEKGVEAHHSVGQVEKGNHILKRIYGCVVDELKQEGTFMPAEDILQIAVKALNDTAGPNGLVPTLLVFGAYPRMSIHDKATATIRERAKCIVSAMEELRIAKARRKVADALSTPHGPDTLSVLLLRPGDDVLVYREKANGTNNAGWTGPWQLLAREGENVLIDIGGPIKFPTTSVRPYYRRTEAANTPEVDDEEADTAPEPSMPRAVAPRRGRPPGARNKAKNLQVDDEEADIALEPLVPSAIAPRRGRPRGAKNKAKNLQVDNTTFTEDVEDMALTYEVIYNLVDGYVVDQFSHYVQDPQQVDFNQSKESVSKIRGKLAISGRNYQPHLWLNDDKDINSSYTTAIKDIEEDIPEAQQLLYKKTAFVAYARAWRELDTVLCEGGNLNEVFLTAKEKSDIDTAIRLRSEGRITTPGEPFEESIWQEIQSLVAEGVFKVVPWEDRLYNGKQVFNSRMVNEIKGKMEIPYEKSRLVIQAWNDNGKQAILTQSPTIQRSSQRLILALAPSLIKYFGMSIALRDITQAYIQSLTWLQRLILFRLPMQIRHQYPKDSIGVCLKPLYGIPESGAHWFLTYWRWLLEQLLLGISTYDPCLLYTKEKNDETFGIVGLQADDTLILGTPSFMKKEGSEITMTGFRAKPPILLTTLTPVNFNGCIVKLLEDGSLVMGQKDQANKIELIDLNSATRNADYRSQRARGAYISTLCQPEAQYDLSVAAQQQNPTDEDVVTLNKRLQWQLENTERGLHFIPIDLTTAKLFVFVDGSFANNKDLSSQIGYMVVLANEKKSEDDGEFQVKGNLIHWSSTKCKRVTGSVLASELFGMSAGADMAIAINTTITNIVKQIGVSELPLVMCTDSMSLYELLVKLGTTKEKRLMIDVMGLREAYERRVLTEIRHIDGKGNPADAFTKDKPNTALQRFIDSNEIVVGMKGWVTRGVRDTGRRDGLRGEKEE